MASRRSARVEAKLLEASTDSAAISATVSAAPVVKKPRGRPQKKAHTVPSDLALDMKTDAPPLLGKDVQASDTIAEESKTETTSALLEESVPVASTSAPRKRKRTSKVSQAEAVSVADGDQLQAKTARVTKAKKAAKINTEGAPQVAKQGKGKAKQVDPNAERYARVEHSGCPETYFKKFKKAISQRMFMVDRARGGSVAYPQEEFQILGSTGNVYTTVIASKIKCNCPDYIFNGRTICKHSIFVLIRILKVAEESDLWYRATLSNQELQMIFEAAPLDPHESVAASADISSAWRIANGLEVPGDTTDKTQDAPIEAPIHAKRQDAVGEDCPVCYEEMTQDDIDQNKLVFDDAPTGCGKPLHSECFSMWVTTAQNKGDRVTCVWCRGHWHVPGITDQSPSKGKGSNRVVGQNYTPMGYLNMAEAAGLTKPKNVT
ncbi:hypothetical protein IAU60_002194 [Kwoniella sp. DSM 27419]